MMTGSGVVALAPAWAALVRPIHVGHHQLVDRSRKAGPVDLQRDRMAAVRYNRKRRFPRGLRTVINAPVVLAAGRSRPLAQPGQPW